MAKSLYIRQRRTSSFDFDDHELLIEDVIEI